MLKITIELTGRTPLLTHNGRLANPLDPIAKQVAQLAKKRKKTEEDYAKLLPLEAYGGLYETPEGFIGMPTENVLACLAKAAAAFKQKTDLQSALLFEANVTPPIYLAGLPIDAHDYAYSDPVNHLFIRTVVIARKRALRSRPILHTPWTTTHEFVLLEDVLNPDELKKIFERAGRLVGLGDWHPRYGLFTTRVLSTEVVKEEVAA